MPRGLASALGIVRLDGFAEPGVVVGLVSVLVDSELVEGEPVSGDVIEPGVDELVSGDGVPSELVAGGLVALRPDASGLGASEPGVSGLGVSELGVSELGGSELSDRLDVVVELVGLGNVLGKVLGDVVADIPLPPIASLELPV